MLNINQNFDLKAPVFNFDRDYFNSVEELNAYDTSNVPNHFVTNVAGMLYQFTAGTWVPILGTTDDDGSIINIGIGNIQIINQTTNPRLYMSTVNGFGSVYASTYLGYSSDDDNKHISLDVNDLYLMIDDSNSATTYIYNDNINISSLNNSQKIQLNVNDTAASGDYGSSVHMCLTDGDNKAIINAVDGFRHIGDDGNESNLYSAGLNISDLAYATTIYSNNTSMYNANVNGGIEINTNKELTEEEQDNGYSPINISLTDGDYTANINAKHGFMHKTEDGFTSYLDGEALNMRSQVGKSGINSQGLSVYDENIKPVIRLQSFEENSLTLGSDKKFKISRQLDNTEGATITGVKSITAFANPSATKVWATDGSTVDLTTKADVAALDAKANASDVLLKKSARGGYYIEENSNQLGEKAFAANYSCNPTGTRSHAEGGSTDAIGDYSHAEGGGTYAVGTYSHAQGSYNIYNINAIHSIGIGTTQIRKNSEFVYFKGGTDPKNGYKYLIGVGGYDGISTDDSTYKSVQEVIADLTSRIEQLEKLTANCVSISNVDEQTN